MKKYLLINFSLLAIILLASCKKNSEVQSNPQLDLTTNLSFKNYVARNMIEKLQVFKYNTTVLNASNQSQFRGDLSNARTADDVQNIYSRYSLNSDVVNRFVLLQAAEQAKLIVDIPELRSMNEEQLNATISKSYVSVCNTLFAHAKNYTIDKINSGPMPSDGYGIMIKSNSNSISNPGKKVNFVSNDIGVIDFESLYYSIPANMSDGEIGDLVDQGLYEFTLGYTTNKAITTEEVFSCAKEAFLALVGSITGITNLGKLIATEGISAGILAISKFIVRNSGWITGAIVAADFGMCIYSASQN